MSDTATYKNAAKVLTGTVVGFTGSPTSGQVSEQDVLHIEKGAIAVNADGRIAWIGAAGELPEQYENAERHDYQGQYLMAGFIDAHVHFPQYRMPAAPGKSLMEWLSKYTFPEEIQYGDEAFAQRAATVFLRELFRNGTTSALTFATVHSVSVDALFEAASEFNMAMVSGKTMMDRMAPEGLTDTPEESYAQSQSLIDNRHKKGRARYAVTPRFAVTSTEEQLRFAGELLKANPSVLMQTHLSESPGEIATVEELFPDAQDYTDVYARFGLLTDRSIFAHGIHLSEREYQRIHDAGASIIHCPTSNNFLGSGLFDLPATKKAARPIAVGLATDIGAGTSYSMLATMAEAYKVAMLKGYALPAFEAYYLATLANAQILRIDDETGSLAVGKYADIIVVNPRATPILEHRQQLSGSLESSLFACMILGDDRLISATYVAGNIVHQID